MIAFISFLLCAAILAGNAADVVSVLPLKDGGVRVNRFDLYLDQEMFTSQATVTFDDENPIALKAKTAHRTRGKTGEWAAARVERDERGLLKVHGVFGDQIVEYENGAHHARRRTHTEGDFRDIVVDVPGRSFVPPNTTTTIITNAAAGKDAMGMAVAYGSNTCFSSDLVQHTLEISVALDYGFFLKVNAALPDTASMEDKQDNVMAALEQVLAVGRSVFLIQLNVNLRIKQVVVATTANSLLGPLRYSPTTGTCNTNALSALNEFSAFSAVNFPTSGHWHLFTNCFPSPGVIGVAFQGMLCETGYNTAMSSWTSSTWLTFPHEFGHNVGAGHNFRSGLGGIMDYGNGQINGIVQYAPKSLLEMCAGLAYVKSRSCPFFVQGSSQAVCGDGVLAGGEECECTSPGSTSCDVCLNCMLKVSPKPTCTTSDDGFVVRTAAMGTTAYVVNSDLLAYPDCCTSSRQLAPTKTSCNDGKDVCSSTGTCAKACGKYALPGCGFDDSGCIQNCLLSGVCYGADLLTRTTQIPAGAVPNGISCVNPKTKISGVCLVGVCVGVTLTPSSIPIATARPTTPKTNTPKPTSRSPTKRPTTRAPSLSPTTRAPSSSPTTETPTTMSPTSLPATLLPTRLPTRLPTYLPTRAPSRIPTLRPTLRPTNNPTRTPTRLPTVAPSKSPTDPGEATPVLLCPTPASFALCPKYVNNRSGCLSKKCAWCPITQEGKIGACAVSADMCGVSPDRVRSVYLAKPCPGANTIVLSKKFKKKRTG